MDKQPVLLKILDFSLNELKALLVLAMNVMLSDDRVRLEEKVLIKLIPDLLTTAFENSPNYNKEAWRKKIKLAYSTLRKEGKLDDTMLHQALGQITSRKKQQACFLALFKIASADHFIDEQEIDYIIKKIAKPWQWPAKDLLKLLEVNRHEILTPGKLIKALMEYISLYE